MQLSSENIFRRDSTAIMNSVDSLKYSGFSRYLSQVRFPRKGSLARRAEWIAEWIDGAPVSLSGKKGS